MSDFLTQHAKIDTDTLLKNYVFCVMCESTYMCFRERLTVCFLLVYRCVGDSRSGSENIMDVMWYFTLSVYICIYIYIYIYIYINIYILMTLDMGNLIRNTKGVPNDMKFALHFTMIVLCSYMHKSYSKMIRICLSTIKKYYLLSIRASHWILLRQFFHLQ